ncbi:protein FAR1-RELATED SEQUENCE 5-like [Beta vulgaris subsp. vulgaris]|uniref:protein FAR1-RELATED SEQUENCE 5-like n=1 Tax=Beta vulgaris subsp. vulgaris TaxID=3555 RepID=UPI0025481711|nr:protein FAR1-RELATED SEQUENCE 5-like [Beta vulgaris subsp. vulgaris]
MTILHKKFVVDNSKLNIGPTKSFRILKENVGGYDNIGASKQDFKNFSRDLKAYIDGSDAQMKNYALFGDMVSFDTTYETNRYNMAMGNNEPTCLITDQDPAMKVAVRKVFKKTEHRFCMWHIMEKVSLKMDRDLLKETDFHEKLRLCVWDLGLEPLEFEEKWNKLIEFYMRFETAMDSQRHSQAEFDNDSKNKFPECKTPLLIEKHASEVFTCSIFYQVQEEVYNACFSCGIEEFRRENDLEIAKINEVNRKRTFEVVFNNTNYETNCSCKMFQRHGLPCRHMVWVWKAKNITMIPDK